MDIKFPLCVLATAAIGYFSYDVFNAGISQLKSAAMHADPAVFPYPKQKVEELLLNARTTVPRRDGDGNVEIWAAGLSQKGVSLRMRYAKGAPVLNCQAAMTRKSEGATKVEADCGSDSTTGSAMEKTRGELRALMFEEHIAATLTGREFNRSRVDAGESVAVFRNLGGMQREAMEMYANDRELMSKMRR